MKPQTHFLTLAVFGLALLAWNNSPAQEREINWKLVSKNLVRALASENEGLRQSAMEIYVRHADRLNIEASVYDVMRVYRNHQSPRVKKLALVTLYKMQNKWAIEFLKLDLRFQDDETLKRMVAAILLEYQAKKKAS
jgi:hypothetical protein